MGLVLVTTIASAFRRRPVRMKNACLPPHGDCFVCGSAASPGLGLRLHADGDVVTGELCFDALAQGPPGFAHGGALAAVLDEAMTIACWTRGRRVLVARLEVEYKKPVPLGVAVRVEARCVEELGRLCTTAGEIRLADGAAACAARATLVEIATAGKGWP
jgi:acyl-coenzyme A thioesterase PaaI-like protein